MESKLSKAKSEDEMELRMLKKVGQWIGGLGVIGELLQGQGSWKN